MVQRNHARTKQATQDCFDSLVCQDKNHQTAPMPQEDRATIVRPEIFHELNAVTRIPNINNAKQAELAWYTTLVLASSFAFSSACSFNALASDNFLFCASTVAHSASVSASTLMASAKSLATAFSSFSFMIR